MATQKIIDIKGGDWSKGISAKQSLAVGGLFSTMRNVDPFDNSGVAKPSVVPDSFTPTSGTPLFLTNFNKSGTAYLLSHSTTDIYDVLRASPYTQTSRTSRISVASAVQGAIIWSSPTDGVLGYVYATASNGLRFCRLPLETYTDTQILTGFNDGNMDSRAMCVGADKNLYVADSPRIDIITRTNGTTGNAGVAWIDSGFVVRDIVNDGTYLVIIADNNTSATASRTVGDYQCRVYFWDMSKVDGSNFLVADAVYDIIGDSYLSVAKVIDGNTYIFGYNGIYVCNSATAPKMIRPFTGGNTLALGRPSIPYQVGTSKGVIYWIDGGTDTTKKHYVYAYGNPYGGQKIFYVPYQDTGADQLQKVLTMSGDNIWVGGDTPKIYVHNTGSTQGNATIKTIDITMPETHRFEYAKVVLREPMSSGMSVQFLASTQNDGKFIASETKSYSASNPRQVLKFNKSQVSADNGLFENIRATVVLTGGACIQRLTVYATPINDTDESI